jgi:glutathione S-transferase
MTGCRNSYADILLMTACYHGQNGLAPKELRDVHPLGKSPVIVDGNLTVAESAVITDYLIRKYGNGRFTTPEGDEQRALDNQYFQHFAEGEIRLLFQVCSHTLTLLYIRQAR